MNKEVDTLLRIQARLCASVGRSKEEARLHKEQIKLLDKLINQIQPDFLPNTQQQ